MRFIHTADWHLGRTLYGHSLLAEQEGLLQDFLAIVKDEHVDAVLIAGDIYDRAIPSAEAVDLFDDIMCKIVLDLKVKVLLIAGNHDSQKRLNFGSKIFSRQYFFIKTMVKENNQPLILHDKYGEVYFCLFPYMEPLDVKIAFSLEDKNVDKDDCLDFDFTTSYVVKNMFAKIPIMKRSVAVAHVFLGGAHTSDSERELSVGGLNAVSRTVFLPFSYTALGHLHNMQMVGAPHIRYSGSLMRYSFSEYRQKKGVLVVDLGAKGDIDVKFLQLTPKHDVNVVRGYMEEISQNRFLYPFTDDYISVELLDREPILDAYGKLSKIYPNLLHIERVDSLYLDNQADIYAQRTNKLLPTELFQEFFLKMTGFRMNEEEEKTFNVQLEKLYAKERECSK